jgi:hypothetical protein
MGTPSRLSLPSWLNATLLMPEMGMCAEGSPSLSSSRSRPKPGRDQLLGSQRAEIKRLSEQMTGLATKLIHCSVLYIAQVTVPISPHQSRYLQSEKTSGPEASRGTCSGSAALTIAVKPLTGEPPNSAKCCRLHDRSKLGYYGRRVAVGT